MTAAPATDHPRLSLVVAARNDDHGGRFLRRIQTFVNALVAQATSHRLASELVFVDWNSPTPFAEALRWPEAPPWFSARLIEVPPDINAALPFAEELKFREWIGKNVGIRRARGLFVLATNVDLVFSDDLMRALTAKLRANRVYRADRLDVAASPDPKTPLDEILAACESAIIRRHGALGDIVVTNGNSSSGSSRRMPRSLVRVARAARAAPATVARHATNPLRLPGVVRERWQRELGLHTDASGDFTLLASSDWQTLRGYPEFPGHGVHVDGLFLYECHFAGLRQVVLPGPVFHLEHARNRPPITRMTQEDTGRAPWISTDELYELTLETIRRKGPVLPHRDDWGLAGVDLVERTPMSRRRH